jgi:hypothetical protein
MAISEIYSKISTEAYFESDRLEVKDEIETLIGKVRTIMFTRKGDVLGSPDFGVDVESYIFETFFDKDGIINDLRNQFYRFIPEAGRYNLQVLVNLVQGTYKDDIIIDILINQERVLGFVI